MLLRTLFSLLVFISGNLFAESKNDNLRIVIGTKHQNILNDDGVPILLFDGDTGQIKVSLNFNIPNIKTVIFINNAVRKKTYKYCNQVKKEVIAKFKINPLRKMTNISFRIKYPCLTDIGKEYSALMEMRLEIIDKNNNIFFTTYQKLTLETWGS